MDLVADREIVVAVGDLEHLGVRQHRRQAMRIAGDRVARADRHQRRTGDARRLGFAERLARTADAGGERDAIALGLLGEGAEHALHRVGQRFERRRLHRLGDAERQADALDQPIAEPAEDQPADAIGIGQREEGGDARPHRIAHRVGPLDPEMVEQTRRVGRHQRRR